MTPYWTNGKAWLYLGKALDVLREVPDGVVNCCVTSPPYFGLRDYGIEGQTGAEKTPAEYVEALRSLFSEVRRVLADDGTLWLNLGDSYASSPRGNKPGSFSTSSLTNPGRQDSIERGDPKSFDRPMKNLLGIPWRVAFALQDDGWTLRNDVIWRKTNPMPSSVKDRFASTYEHVFMFSKSQRYFFDLDGVRVPHMMKPQRRPSGRPEDEIPRLAPRQSWPMSQRDNVGVDGHPLGKNPGDVWDISTKPFSEAHFATFPPELPERCILAGCKPGGLVLDPYSGSGTTGMVALRNGLRYMGIELNPEYLDLSIRTRFAS